MVVFNIEERFLEGIKKEETKVKRITFWAIVALLFVATEVETPTAKRSPLTGWERSVVLDGPAVTARWKKSIEHALTQNRSRLPRDLIAGIMLKESMGKPRAKNPSGATGLLMVKPIVCRELRIRSCNLLDPHQNLSAGVRYLGLLKLKYGFTGEKLILAYGVGPERANEIIRTGQQVATHKYVRQVLYARRMSKNYLANS